MKLFIITKEWSDSLLKNMFYVKEIKKDGFESIIRAFDKRFDVEGWIAIQKMHYNNLVTIDDQSINDEKDTLPPDDSPTPALV